MIPTYDKLLRPLLVLATERQITRRDAEQWVIKHFKLTAEEAAAKVPSGGSTVTYNRTAWAMTFLTKAGLIAKVAPKTYKATNSAAAFLKEHPSSINDADLKTIKGYKEAWAEASEKRRAKKEPEVAVLSTATPEEAISQGIKTLESDLRARLLDSILGQTPEFFEKLVLQVLKAMGYGSENEDSLKHVGQSGDEGIDGRINQDALGLDQICVQAKRYAPDRAIDRMTIQAFVGSLAGQGVTKGIFITTSYFKGTAEEFVTRGSATKVVLVDGEKLIDLMLRHRIGTRVKESYEVFEIDQNYFDEE